MADFVKISDATALALHSMVHLAMAPEEQFTTAEIADSFEASRHHLAKVHQKLKKAGLMESKRGPSGGVLLGRSPEQITLLEIYEVMEGEIVAQPCLFGHDVCPRSDCMLQTLLPDLAERVRDYFKETTLAQLAEKTNWEG